MHLKAGRAWARKKGLRCLWTILREGMARRSFKQWFWWATRSRLKPVVGVARMLRRHLDHIVTCCRHPMTNGVAEGLDSKIMTIKRRACGLRNQHHVKTAVSFYCGGLVLYPR